MTLPGVFGIVASLLVLVLLVVVVSVIVLVALLMKWKKNIESEYKGSYTITECSASGTHSILITVTRINKTC